MTGTNASAETCKTNVSLDNSLAGAGDIYELPASYAQTRFLASWEGQPQEFGF